MAVSVKNEITFSAGALRCGRCHLGGRVTCIHALQFLQACGDLDEGSLVREALARYATVARPRVIWLPLAVDTTVMCTIQRVAEEEILGPNANLQRERRDSLISAISWPESPQPGSPPFSDNWRYEVRDMRAPFAIRTLGQFDGRISTEAAQKIVHASRAGTTVLLDPTGDSLLKVVRTLRDRYEESRHFAAAIGFLVAKKNLPCPNSWHSIKQNSLLASTIRDIYRQMFGRELNLTGDWGGTELGEVLVELAFGYTYAMETENQCAMCASMSFDPNAMPDDLVPSGFQ